MSERKRTWRVHKVYGSVRIVVVNADIATIEQGGTLVFRDNWFSPRATVVAAYPAHAWRFVEEIEE